MIIFRKNRCWRSLRLLQRGLRRRAFTFRKVPTFLTQCFRKSFKKYHLRAQSIGTFGVESAQDCMSFHKSKRNWKIQCHTRNFKDCRHTNDYGTLRSLRNYSVITYIFTRALLWEQTIKHKLWCDDHFQMLKLAAHWGRIVALFLSLVPDQTRTATEFVMDSSHTLAKATFAGSFGVESISVIASNTITNVGFAGGSSGWLMTIATIAITDGSLTTVHSVFEIALIIGLSEHQLLSID